MRKTPSQLLLQLRSLHESLSRRELGTATVAVSSAEALADMRAAALSAATLPGNTDPARFAAAIASRSALASLVSSQRLQVDIARVQLEQAKAQWLAAEREREAADRLVETEREHARDERDAQAQREADDLALARHGRDLEGGAS
jgi:flagellar export protein FliJ